MATKQNAIQKAYAMFGTGEWVAENGKVKETRLIKELVEFAEKMQKQCDAQTQIAIENSSAKWRIEYQEKQNEQLKTQNKELQAKIDSFNVQLDSIASFVYDQRIK